MIIKKLRLQRGWSQDQLSQLSGLSIRTIQRIEKGQNPGLESMKSLAAVFETTITALQEDTNMTNIETNLDTKVSAEEKLAFERVRRIKGFYLHLIRYAFFIPLMFIINFLTNPEYIWAIWPALGWGIGVLSHSIKAFDLIRLFGPEWEKRQVEKQLDRKL